MATTWPFIISTASRSNSLKRRARCAFALLLAAVSLVSSRPAPACPFCKALKPTLSQRRAEADVVALAEVVAPGEDASHVKLHRVHQGASQVAAGQNLSVPLHRAVRPGELLLLFGTSNDEAGAPRGAAAESLSWHAVPVDETSYAYFARAPQMRLPSAERLAYFARYLEHPDALVAEDAYLEFGHAPFDQVSEVAHLLPAERVPTWLADPGVPSYRKGFYGLVLGLADDPRQRATNAELLRRRILAPEDDFRAGFDGVLGGYLLLAGPEALDLIESRYLANPRAADGDVRHALSALRFYREFGRQIPKRRLNEALRQLLARPEFAEAATVDLARWQDWDAAEQVAALYRRPEYAQAATRRAIVGYLLACPEPQAAELLAELRGFDPRGVSEAEQILTTTGSLPKAQ